MPHNAWKQQEAVQEPPDLQEAEESPGPQHVTQQEIRAVLDQLEGCPDAEATEQVTHSLAHISLPSACSAPCAAAACQSCLQDLIG